MSFQELSFPNGVTWPRPEAALLVTWPGPEAALLVTWPRPEAALLVTWPRPEAVGFSCFHFQE